MGGHRLMAAAAAAAACTLAVLAPPAAAKKHLTEEPRTRLSVATYNVCTVNCQGGRFRWEKRRDAVARTVAAADPAVLAVQEAPTLPWRGTTQWADLTALLAGKGYVQPSDADGCTQGCTRGAHLYVDPDRVRVFTVREPSGMPEPPQPCFKYLSDPDLPARKKGPYYNDWYRYDCAKHVGYVPFYDVSTGMESQMRLSGVAWGGIQDRNMSWAYLQDIATGGVFMAVSVHLPNEKTAQAETLRRRAASGIAAWIVRRNAELGLSGIPVLVLGDLNSFAARQPHGAQQVFAEAGFVDSFDDATRINDRYPTVNVTPLTRHWDGFPPRPPKYGRAASRIDYVLGAHGVVGVRHEVFLRLRPDGTFDERYRGSDHNLVLVTVSMPVVLSS